MRNKERSQAERTNARLKDEFGGRNIRLQDPDKVMSHLMSGMLALTADQAWAPLGAPCGATRTADQTWDEMMM
jgi:hypothetical protein